MSLPKSLEKYSDLIQEAFQEHDTGFSERKDGLNWWIWLKNGFIDSESGCHSIHEETLKECIFRLKYYVKGCVCESCKGAL